MDANHATEKFTVLTPAEAETLAAIAERIFPATDTPGAVQIGALHYIDIALAGDYAALAPLYRQGLRSINRCARSRFGARFSDLAVHRLSDGVERRQVPPLAVLGGALPA